MLACYGAPRMCCLATDLFLRQGPSPGLSITDCIEQDPHSESPDPHSPGFCCSPHVSVEYDAQEQPNQLNQLNQLLSPQHMGTPRYPQIAASPCSPVGVMELLRPVGLAFLDTVLAVICWLYPTDLVTLCPQANSKNRTLMATTLHYLGAPLRVIRAPAHPESSDCLCVLDDILCAMTKRTLTQVFTNQNPGLLSR